jgi:hypothetical protein
MAKMIIVAALSLTTVFGQAPSDLERRVAELEEKLRQIDPTFGKDASATEARAAGSSSGLHERRHAGFAERGDETARRRLYGIPRE